MGRLVRKDDHDVAITGTLEHMTGNAGIASATRLPDGTLDIDYEGYTEIWWDEQKTAERDGQRVFIDEYGDEVLESEVEVVDEEGDSDES